MTAYPIPHDEIDRLAILRDHNLLDCSFDPDFDDLVHLAAIICDVPISLVTFIDEHRQVFKARVGLRSTETSRSISFCTHAIMSRELLVVPDATQDARFSTNPDVVNPPNIRFYAGMPILSPSQVPLGSLCVVDHEPREIDARQRECLRTLARMAESHVKRRLNSYQAARSAA